MNTYVKLYNGDPVQQMFLIIINLYLNDDNVLDYSKVCCLYLSGGKNKPILDSVSSYLIQENQPYFVN